MHTFNTFGNLNRLMLGRKYGVCKSSTKKKRPHLIERRIQPLQNLCPQLVCTGSLRPRRQIGHSYLLSSGGSKYSSYPSDLGSSYDKSSLGNKLTGPGSSEASRTKAACSSRRKERVIVTQQFPSFYLSHNTLSCTTKENCKICMSKTKGRFPIPQFNAGNVFRRLKGWTNLVPRVFSLSNMAAAGEKTLAHSELKRSLIGAFHSAFIRAPVSYTHLTLPTNREV